MTATFLKPLLIGLLAASMLVGCTEIPTAKQDPGPAAGSEDVALTSTRLKELISEIQQTLTVLKTLNGAYPELSPASGYRLSGLAVAQTSNPWLWEDKAPEADGTVESTRHVIERDAAGTIVTDIRSVRRWKPQGDDATYSLVEIVEASPVMRLGTYTIQGESSMTGATSDPDFKRESQQTTRFTPKGGGTTTSATMALVMTATGQTATATGTLPDGSTVSYESITSGSWTQSSKSEMHQKMTLAVTQPGGRTIRAENDIQNTSTSSESGSSFASKGSYQVSLGSVMKVRFAIDTLSQTVTGRDEHGGHTYETSHPRNQITADLLDGAGERISAIALEVTTDHSKPPTQGTIQLPGEEPSELDMSFMMDIMRLHETVGRTLY